MSVNIPGVNWHYSVNIIKKLNATTNTPQNNASMSKQVPEKPAKLAKKYETCSVPQNSEQGSQAGYERLCALADMLYFNATEILAV